MRFLSALCCVLTLSACGIFGAKSPTRELFDCRVEAIKGLVGPDADAEAIVLDLATGKVTLLELVAVIQPAHEVYQKLMADLEACSGSPVAVPAEVSNEVSASLAE